MSSLTEFQEMVNEIEDEELLEVAEGLLRDLVEIQNMREKIEMLEATLSKGKRASFWFFAMGLDQEQVSLATDTVIGRKRLFKDRAEKKKIKEEIEKAEQQTQVETTLEEILS